MFSALSDLECKEVGGCGFPPPGPRDLADVDGARTGFAGAGRKRKIGGLAALPRGQRLRRAGSRRDRARVRKDRLEGRTKADRAEGT